MRISNIISGLGFYMICVQQLIAQNPNFFSYGATYGLSRSDVTCIYQDSREMFWVGTSGAGMYRFVRGRFTQESLPPDATGYVIRKLDEDGDGYLYILSEKGLLRYDGRDILELSHRAESILDFALMQDGVWWLTDDSLLVKKASIRTGKRTSADLLATTPLVEDALLVIGSNEIEFVDKDFHVDEKISITNPPKGQWLGYTHDTDTSLWIASRDGHLIQFNGFGISRVNTDLPDITDIEAGALGTLWLAGSKGISIYHPQDSAFIVLPIAAPVNCLYFDRYNRLWIGSSTEGLIRYFGEQHRIWDLPDDAKIIFSGENADAAMVTTHAGSLLTLGNISEQVEPPVNDGNVRQVYRDDKGRSWVLTENSLWMYHDTSWILMDSAGLVRGMVIVGDDNSGNIWLARENVLMRYGMKPVAFPLGVTFSTKQIAGSIPRDETISIQTNHNGQPIRVGSRTIGIIDQDRYQQTHQMGYNVLCADLDSAGYLWLGTQAAGIFRVKPKHGESPKPLLTTYPLRVSDIVFIRHTGESIIAGTDRNIIRLHPDTSGLFVRKVDVLNEDAGVTLSGLNRDRIAMTDDGHLLVMTDDDVIEFDLLHSHGASLAPSVSISQVMINGTDLRDTRYRQLLGPFNQQLGLPEFLSAENTVTFVFSGNSIEDEHLFFQWRLDGFQEEWSEPSAKNEVQFSGLSAGPYALEVRVCDASGNCGEMGEPWRFTIKKALWQYWWFWPTIALIAVVAISLLFRQRLRRQKHDADREKRRLEAELNALTLEQKSLQLQMNPHFIFNALQTVRSHIHEDKLEEARDNLTRFAKLMRVMLEMSRSEKISLEDELEFLQSYVDVEKMSHRLPVLFEIEMDEEIETHAIEIPPMIIQPILENAIKYGGDGNAINVNVHITKRNHLLVVSIEDNGTGFGTHASAHKSASLDIIRNRLAHLGRGGGLEISQGTEGGAIVELRIPC